jgi:hypothetical protein
MFEIENHSHTALGDPQIIQHQAAGAHGVTRPTNASKHTGKKVERAVLCTPRVFAQLTI